MTSILKQMAALIGVFGALRACVAIRQSLERRRQKSAVRDSFYEEAQPQAEFDPSTIHIHVA
jgi:hypothetical protein